MSLQPGNTSGYVSDPRLWRCDNCRASRRNCSRRRPCLPCLEKGVSCSYPDTQQQDEHDPEGHTTLFDDISYEQPGQRTLSYHDSLTMTKLTKTETKSLHPSATQISKLWERFLDYANPLIMIVHRPTVQTYARDAAHKENLTPEFEAFLFSMYCASLVTMSPEDVEELFGKRKSEILPMYHRIARVALLNADVARTTKLMTLQAFFLFLFSMLYLSDHFYVWGYCGIAIHVARRMGIDHGSMDLSTFENEMRHRLWLQLQLLDTAVSCSVGMSGHEFRKEKKLWLNLDDFFLHPLMGKLRNTSASCVNDMAFVHMQFDVNERVWGWTKVPGLQGGIQEFLTLTPAISDAAIGEMKDIASRYRLASPTDDPLQLFTEALSELYLYRAIFSSRHPRQHNVRMDLMSRQERRIVRPCVKILQLFRDIQKLSPFSWYLENHFPWDALVFVLYDLQDHTEGQTWRLVNDIYFMHYKKRGREYKNVFESALRALIMVSWDVHDGRCKEQGCTPPPRPEINDLILQDVPTEPPAYGHVVLDWREWDRRWEQLKKSLEENGLPPLYVI